MCVCVSNQRSSLDCSIIDQLSIILQLQLSTTVWSMENCKTFYQRWSADQKNFVNSNLWSETQNVLPIIQIQILCKLRPHIKYFNFGKGLVFNGICKFLSISTGTCLRSGVAESNCVTHLQCLLWLKSVSHVERVLVQKGTALARAKFCARIEFLISFRRECIINDSIACVFPKQIRCY